MNRSTAQPFGPSAPVPGSGISRRSLLRGAGLGLVAVAGSRALVACGNEAEGGAQDLGEVTYVSFLPFQTLSYTGEMMAIAGGFDADHGIDLKVEEARGTAPSLQAVISGAGLIARCNTIDLVLARQEGQPLVNIGTIARGPAQRINFSQENPLATAEDFVGKTIGIPSEGGSTENNLRLTLEHAGVNPDEVNMQVVAPTPATWEMIQRGQIDGFLTSPDQSFLLLDSEDQADAVVLGDLAPVVSDRQYFVTTEEHIENSRDQVSAYCAALHDAVQSIVDDSSAAVETLREEYSFASLDHDGVAADSIDVQVENFVNDDEPDPLRTDPEIWRQGLTELEEAGYIDPVEDPEAWMTNDLLP